MSSLAKLGSLCLVGLVAAACSAAPSTEEVGASGEALVAGVYGSISASPNPVYVTPNEVGSTTLSWTWSESPHTYTYGCVYAQINGGVPLVVDCEKPDNHYTTAISWLAPGDTYVFGIIPQATPDQVNYANPPPWAATVNVEVIETCSSACTATGYNGVAVSCESAPGATCSESTTSVTCGGVVKNCEKGPTGPICKNPCDGPNELGTPVSCTADPGTTCTVNLGGVTCNGVTTICPRNPRGCPTC